MKLLIGCGTKEHGFLPCNQCDYSYYPTEIGVEKCDKFQKEFDAIRKFEEV